jgi:sigma-B regulation protein RsbU (phosphoserine phosphatase)
VRSLNEQFAELNQQGRFATAVIGTYLANNDVLAVSNAGHPPPLIYRPAIRQWQTWDHSAGRDATNLPLGVATAVSFVQQRTTLQRGDVALFYTDALTETTDAAGRQLGREGLARLVDGLDASAPGDMLSTLVERLDEHHGGRPLEDDLSILLLHHNAGDPPRLSLREKLDVYAKVFRLKSVS